MAGLEGSKGTKPKPRQENARTRFALSLTWWLIVLHCIFAARKERHGVLDEFKPACTLPCDL